jgi:predicted nucleotidyltransferase
MDLQTKQEQVLEELASTLRRHYGRRLARMILFGSRARGEAADQADYDVLVVLEGSVDPRTERNAVTDLVYRVCWEHDAVVMLHFVSATRYATEQSPMMMNVRREGVAL